MAQESATAEPNSVLQVVQPGYELNGRLLRPARVIVARAALKARPPPLRSSSGLSLLCMRFPAECTHG